MHFRIPRLAIPAAAALLFASTNLDRVSAASARPGGKSPELIVIGFLGGFVSRDNPIHLEVQLANLRESTGTYQLKDLLPLPFDARLL